MFTTFHLFSDAKTGTIQAKVVAKIMTCGGGGTESFFPTPSETR